jgi:hypothetical protein
MDSPAGRRARAPRQLAPRLDGLRGAVRLAVSGVLGVTHIAEGLHARIARLDPPLGRRPQRPAPGISGLVYRSVRGTTRVVGRGLETALSAVHALLPPDDPAGDDADAGAAGAGRAARAVLNGVVGDHLAHTSNPLAIRMQLLPRAAPGERVVVLVHGLCMHDGQWTRGGHDHGLALHQALGWCPVYARYNSGRHVAANGADLARELEALVAGWPVTVESLAIVGHSMGGLVAHSAVHQAQQAQLDWPRRLQRMVFLGTPHHGAPLEQAGHRLHQLLEISPYVAPFASLAGLRSAGITDLRHGRVLHPGAATAVPLPAGVACHAIAGALGAASKAAVVGDGLVTVASALGQHRRGTHRLQFPAGHTWVARGVGHLALLDSRAVSDQLCSWFAAAPA